MNETLKRAFLWGMVSQVLAFATMYAILCGLFNTEFLPSFFLTSLALLAVILISTRRTHAKPGPKMFAAAGGVILLGFASLVQIDAELVLRIPYPLAAFLVLQGLLWRRLLRMFADVQYLRRLLLEQYLTDIKIVIALALVVTVINIDPSWSGKMLPFFTGFLLTRMTALSLATRATKQKTDQASLAERVQRRMPLVIIGTALFIGWVLTALGGSIWQLLLRLLTPLFDGLGHAIQWLMESDLAPEWLKSILGWLLSLLWRLICWLGFCPETSTDGDGESPPRLELTNGDGTWMLYLLAAVGVLLLGTYLYFMFRRNLRPYTKDGVLEVRTFIRKKEEATPRPSRFAHGSLTKMRRLYRAFLLKMHRRGFVRQRGQTALELAGSIAAAAPEKREAVEELTALYMRERYGGHSVEEHVKRAEQAARQVTEK